MISSSKVSLRVGKLRGDFPRRTPNLVNCLMNNFLHCELELLISNSKVSFGVFLGSHFGEFLSPEDLQIWSE